MSVRIPAFVVVCDDQEDLLALRVMRALHLAGVIRILCVVVNGMAGPRSLAKGVLQDLEGVPVGIGSNPGEARGSHALDDQYASAPDLPDGYQLLTSALRSANNGVYMVVTWHSRSRSTALSTLLERERGLIAHSVRQLTILGDAWQELELTYRRMGLRVPTDVLSRETTNSHTIPFDVFREMARWCNQIARWLIERTLAERSRAERLATEGRANPDHTVIYLARGVPVPDLTALLVALSSAGRVPFPLSGDGHLVEVRRPSSLPDDTASHLRDLLHQGLLDSDPETRRAAMEAIATKEARRAAEEMDQALPAVVSTSVGEHDQTVSVVCASPVRPKLANACREQALETLQRVFPGLVRRVSIGPSIGEEDDT